MTDITFKRPSLRQRRQHLIRQLFNGWPWIVWMSAALAVLLLLPGGLYRIRFHGTAERTYEYVSPLENGRLKAIWVDLGDAVQTNQLLCELSNDALSVQMMKDRASLSKSKDTASSLRFELEKLQLERSKTTAELQILKAKWKRTEDLLAKNLVLEQEIDDLRPDVEAMERLVKQYSTPIALLEARLAAALKDTDAIDSDELQKMQDSQTKLFSTTAGIVAEILHLPGDTVTTGDPIIRISNLTTSKVIAFIPESQTTEVSVGEKCRVITSIGKKVYYGKVMSVTADIRKLPVFTGFGDQILRGRRLVVQLDNDQQLTPGEQVIVVPDISIFKQWFGSK